MNNQEAKLVRHAQKKEVHTENTSYVFHLPSPLTHGKLSIYEGVFRKPGVHKNLHYHKKLTEAFTVLEGEFMFFLKDRELILEPYDSIVIPPRVIHGFRANLPNSRLQITFTGSSNRDDFFIQLAKIINGEIKLDRQEKERFYNQFDQYAVPDNLHIPNGELIFDSKNG